MSKVKGRFNNMTEEEYQKVLANAPTDHFSQEFIDFLVKNNAVKEIGEDWLVIENIKYWTPENDWLTAFYIGNRKTSKHWQDFTEKLSYLSGYVDDIGEREWLVKAPSKRTIDLWHIHLYKK